MKHQKVQRVVYCVHTYIHIHLYSGVRFIYFYLSDENVVNIKIHMYVVCYVVCMYVCVHVCTCTYVHVYCYPDTGSIEGVVWYNSGVMNAC